MRTLIAVVVLMILGCSGLPTSSTPPAETPPPAAPALSPGERAAKIANAGHGDASALAAAVQAEGLDAAGFDQLMYEVARSPTERAKYLAGAPAEIKAP